MVAILHQLLRNRVEDCNRVEKRPATLRWHAARCRAILRTVLQYRCRFWLAFHRVENGLAGL